MLLSLEVQIEGQAGRLDPSAIEPTQAQQD
jgi:hypothetical protein